MMKPYVKSFMAEVEKGQEYYVSFISSILYLPVSILIYFFLFRYLLQGENESGMTLSQIINYYTVISFLKAAFSQSMSEVYYVYQDINQGILDVWLIKPVSYPLSRYCRALGGTVLNTATSLLILLIIFYGKYTIGSLLCFFVSVLLGFTLLFLLMFFLGSLTFWLKNVLTLRDIFWIVFSVFSGELLPLDMFPYWFHFFRNNPLICIYDIPYRVLNTDISEGVSILGMQFVYVLLTGILVAATWSVGIRRYESQGG